MSHSGGAPLRQLTILGATGSIGASTLDVVARHADRFRVIALAAHSQVERMFEHCVRFAPRYAVLVDARSADLLERRVRDAGLDTKVLAGAKALQTVAVLPEVDTVMAAIVGAAGLEPSLAAARAGKRVLLANKEALVMAGRLFLDAVRDCGAQLLPIDSEHNAILQCLPGRGQRRVERRRRTSDPAHRLGGPVPHRGRRPARRSHARAGLRPSQLGDGPEDIGRLGDPDEQGA